MELAYKIFNKHNRKTCLSTASPSNSHFIKGNNALDPFFWGGMEDIEQLAVGFGFLVSF